MRFNFGGFMQVLNEEDVKNWIPSGEEKKVVIMLSAFGHTPEEIALVIYPNGPISVSSLRRKFSDELKNGKIYFKKWLLEEMTRKVHIGELVLVTLYNELFGKDKEIENEKEEGFMSEDKVKFCVDCEHRTYSQICAHPNLGISIVTGEPKHKICHECRTVDFCGVNAKWFESKEVVVKENENYYDKVKEEINLMADTLPKISEKSDKKFGDDYYINWTMSTKGINGVIKINYDDFYIDENMSDMLCDDLENIIKTYIEIHKYHKI